MIAGLLAQIERVFGLEPDLALLLFGVGVVVLGLWVARTKPGRMK